MFGPRQNETPVWVIPVFLLVTAAVLAVLLMRALHHHGDMPVRGAGPGSPPTVAEGSPTRSAGSGNGRSCGGPSNGRPVAASQSASAGQETGRVATVRLENIRGGYSFRHSPDWRVEKSGQTTRVIGPDHDFVVSFGPGPSGGLPVAYDQFTEVLRDTYRGVQLHDNKVRCVRGGLAATARGEGVNSRGTDFNFLAVLIKPSTGHTVGAFGAWRPKEQGMREAVEEVMASLEVARPPT
jgi:hypothetical protein